MIGVAFDTLEQVKELVAALRKVAIVVDPTQILAASSHEADNRFLEFSIR